MAQTQLSHELEPYIRSVFDIPDDVQVFPNGSPTLSCTHMNRIIIYAGCSNPPHLGHLAVLQNAQKCGKDFGAIANIIYPAADEFLSKKEQTTPPLILTRAQRAGIWNSLKLPNTYAPSYTYPAPNNFATRIHTLVRRIKSAGYKIRLAYLSGPDHLETFHPNRVDGSKDYIYSESPYQKLDPAISNGNVNGCTPWRSARLDYHAAYEWARAQASQEVFGRQLSQTESGQLVERCVSNIHLETVGNKKVFIQIPKQDNETQAQVFQRRLRELAQEYCDSMKDVKLADCKSLDNPIRFVPDSDGEGQSMSSTKIREILDRMPLTCELPQELRAMLIAPDVAFWEIQKTTFWMEKRGAGLAAFLPETTVEENADNQLQSASDSRARSGSYTECDDEEVVWARHNLINIVGEEEARDIEMEIMEAIDRTFAEECPK